MDGGVGGSAGVAGSGGVAGGGGGAGTAGAGGFGTPVLLLETDADVRQMAIGNSHALLAGSTPGTLGAASLSGTGKDSWIDADSDLWGVALDGADFYAADFTNNRLIHGSPGIPLSPDLLDVAPAQPYLVALSPTHVYFDDDSSVPASVERIPRSGGAKSTVAAGLPAPQRMVFAQDALWLTTLYQPELYKLDPVTNPASPAAFVTLATGTGTQALAVTSTFVYFASFETGKCPIDSTSVLYRAFVDDGSVQELATSAQGVTAMAVDGDTLYYSTIGTCPNFEDATIMRLSLGTAGATPEPVATGQARVRDIAVDASALYWLSAGGFNTGGPPAGIIKMPKGG